MVRVSNCRNMGNSKTVSPPKIPYSNMDNNRSKICVSRAPKQIYSKLHLKEPATFVYWFYNLGKNDLLNLVEFQDIPGPCVLMIS